MSEIDDAMLSSGKMDMALEISMYIDRFHNLDLFQQGWYALKTTCNWEGAEQGAGMPSRVVQYEAPEGTTDGLSTIWHISDTDHSFCTRPFRIKYARQDVVLAVMVSFTLPVTSAEAMLKSSVLMKFELLFSPLDGFLFFNSMHLELPSVSSHLYRIPPKALHGVHGYCPLHFDACHMALVDLFIHTVMLSVSHHEVSSQTQGSGSSELTHSLEQNKDMGFQMLLLNSRSALATQLSKLGYHGVNNEQPIESKVLENNSVVSDIKTRKSLEVELSRLWNLFLKLHREKKDSICKLLRTLWIEERVSQCSMWVVNLKPSVADNGGDSWQYLKKHGSRKGYEDPVISSAARAELHRKGLMQSQMNGCSLEDMHIFGSPLQQPIVFVEQQQFSQSVDADKARIVESFDRNASEELRIVVFVHGFQGHHLDLRLVRNHWLLADPHAEFLMSEANEERTTGDFCELGQRLADEVAAFLKRKIGKGMKHGIYTKYKVSFVGHSIGNLIIRAALAEAPLQPYLKYLHTFLSISGPHLGYLYSSNLLFNSGLWVLKKLRASPCMHQLTFTDKPSIQDCFLFKLSQAKTFEYFQHVILLSSPQDRYVPYHSARIDMCQAALRDTKRGAAYAAMVQNCMSQLKYTPPTNERSFIRCDVNFDISSQARTFNGLIGRTAHIEFLETDAFIRFILWTFPKCFS